MIVGVWTDGNQGGSNIIRHTQKWYKRNSLDKTNVTPILCYMYFCKSDFYFRFGFSVVAPFSSAQCVDGTYKHDGRDCCLCPAGTSAVRFIVDLHGDSHLISS